MYDRADESGMVTRRSHQNLFVPLRCNIPADGRRENRRVPLVRFIPPCQMGLRYLEGVLFQGAPRSALTTTDLNVYRRGSEILLTRYMR